MTTEGLPTRADVEDKWTAIIESRMTREEVHFWAEPLMLGDKIDDMMVASALQYLHGFDLTGDKSGDPFLLNHGPPGEYIRSTDDVAQELERWRAHCGEYDADPVGWAQRARETARQRTEERDQRDRT